MAAAQAAHTSGTAGGQSAAAAHGDGVVLKDLSEAEQRIISNLKTATALLQSVHRRLSGGEDGQPASQSSPEVLTKEYIEGVQKVQETLVGIDEKLTYRIFDRTTYGPQLDFACTADSVVYVHDQLKGLKDYLTSVISDKEKTADGQQVGGGDVEMRTS